MGFLFLTFVVILCWIIYSILQWTKSIDPSKDGTMLYVPQKTDDGGSKDTNICHKEVEETQVEKLEKEELEDEEEEFEEEKIQPEAEKVIAELNKDEEEKVEDEKRASEGVKEEEKWDEDFLSYDEQVTKDEFDVRVAEILIKVNEMGIAEEGFCDECSEEHKGECRGENETKCCPQIEDKVEESGHTERTVVREEVTSIENLRLEGENKNIIEERPYHEGDAAHPIEESITKDNDFHEHQETVQEKSEEVTVVEKEFKSHDVLKLDDENELRNSTILNHNFISKTEDEADNLNLGYNKDFSETDVLSQCVNTVILDSEDKHLAKFQKEIQEESVTELSTEHEKDILNEINEEIESFAKSLDNEVIEERKEESEISGENKEEESEVGEEVDLLLSKRGNKGGEVVEFEKSKEATVEEDFETKMVIENKEELISEETEHILKEASAVEKKDEIEIENKELKSIEKEEVEEAKLISKEYMVLEDKNDTGTENKDELTFKCHLLPILNFKENKDDAELQSKQDTGVEDKDEIEIDDKEEFLSKDDKKDSFLQILKDLNEAESPKGIEEAIELFEDDGDDVFEKPRENEKKLKVIQVSKEDDDESETLKIEEHNDSNLEEISSKEESEEVLEETNATDENRTNILEDTNIEDEVLEEDKQESKIVKDLKETEKDDKYHTNLTDVHRSETLDINDTKLLENDKAETEISVENEKDKLRINVTENIKEQIEEKSYTEGHRIDEEKPTFPEVKNLEIKIQEEEGEESKILTNIRETEMSNSSKNKTSITDTERETAKNEKKNESNSSQHEFLSKFKEVGLTDFKGTESGNKILNFKSQKEYRDFHSSEVENKENSNKTVIITHEGDYVHNINEEIEISEVIGKEILHQQKIEYTEVADEEEVLYRNVVKCGEEEFVEEFQTKNEIFNEKSCTSSVVTNEEISSSSQTTSTTITKVINLSYTSEECSTENIEIRTIIDGQGNLIPMTDNEQFKNLDIGLIKETISSESPLNEKISTSETINVENVSKDGATEFKKPVGGVYLFGGEEFLNKIKSRKLIVDGYEKEQHENGEEWRLSTLNKGTDEGTSKTTSVSSSTKTTTTTSQMRNQKSQLKQDIKQIHLSSNAFDNPDAIPVLSANVSQPTIKEASSTQFSESHFQDGFTMTSHNGGEGEIISEIPAFQTESTLIHLNKDRNKGPVRRRKPEKSRDNV